MFPKNKNLFTWVSAEMMLSQCIIHSNSLSIFNRIPVITLPGTFRNVIHLQLQYKYIRIYIYIYIRILWSNIYCFSSTYTSQQMLAVEHTRVYACVGRTYTSTVATPSVVYRFLSMNWSIYAFIIVPLGLRALNHESCACLWLICLSVWLVSSVFYSVKRGIILQRLIISLMKLFSANTVYVSGLDAAVSTEHDTHVVPVPCRFLQFVMFFFNITALPLPTGVTNPMTSSRPNLFLPPPPPVESCPPMPPRRTVTTFGTQTAERITAVRHSVADIAADLENNDAGQTQFLVQTPFGHVFAPSSQVNTGCLAVCHVSV